MNQHRIPQDISSYEFRLVGNMTLRQFMKMGLGVLLAVMFYTSNLAFLWRFLGVLFSVVAGFAFAFIPINERPLEQWVFAYLTSIYSPTIYIWHRDGAGIDIVPFVKQARQARFFKKVVVKDKAPKIDEFVKSLPQQATGQQSLGVSGLSTEKQKETAPSSAQGQGLSWDQLVGFWEKSKSGKEKTKEAEFLGPSLPAAPITPDLVNGLVVDGDGNEVPGAIVEIQDIDGNPARAMRTNGLGQFQTATPLPKGDYLIVVEKEPFRFDIVKLGAEGKIIPPIKIQARKERADG